MKRFPVQPHRQPLEPRSAGTRRSTRAGGSDGEPLHPFGEAAPTPAAQNTIVGLAGRLRGGPGAVRVEGYTDAIGTDAANLALSNRRAASVRTALLSAVAGLTVVATGRGKTQPVAPNEQGGEDFPEGRAKNRRVTISYRG